MDCFWWLPCHSNQNFLPYPSLLEGASEDTAWDGAFLLLGPQETFPNPIILSRKPPHVVSMASMLVSMASMLVDRSMAPSWCTLPVLRKQIFKRQFCPPLMMQRAKHLSQWLACPLGHVAEGFPSQKRSKIRQFTGSFFQILQV